MGLKRGRGTVRYVTSDDGNSIALVGENESSRETNDWIFGETASQSSASKVRGYGSKVEREKEPQERNHPIGRGGSWQIAIDSSSGTHLRHRG